ncbi:hypothetical protein SUGI_0210510 [Cryptomeria japonica]|nr:hypothetical protein SUGI_0210510 [Cryptomeria japonica]
MVERPWVYDERRRKVNGECPWSNAVCRAEASSSGASFGGQMEKLSTLSITILLLRSGTLQFFSLAQGPVFGSANFSSLPFFPYPPQGL